MTIHISTHYKKSLEDKGYEVVGYRTQSKSEQQQHYFAINLHENLGEGMFGSVYKAYRIDAQTNTLSSQPVAVKIYKNKSEFSEKEAEFLKRYYWVQGPVHSHGKIYLFTDILPGEEISKDMHVKNKTDEEVQCIKLNDMLKKLNFEERIAVLFSIMTQIDLIHHETVSTGSPIIHADLKGENIRVHIQMGPDNKVKKINVFVYDFGLSHEGEHNPNALIKTIQSGTALYVAPEILSDPDDDYGMRGLKSDIYSLVPIFVAILNGSDPFKYKNEFYKNRMIVNVKQFFNLSYNIDDILQDIALPPYPFNIKKYLLAFLGRMQKFIYFERPDSHEALRFFTLLNNFCLAHQGLQATGEKISDDDCVIIQAKLALLCAGLYYHDVSGTQPALSQPMKEYQPPASSTEKITFEDYSFENNIDVCKQIIKLFQNNELNEKTLLGALNRDFIQKEIVREASQKQGIKSKSLFGDKKKAHDQKHEKVIVVKKSGYL